MNKKVTSPIKRKSSDTLMKRIERTYGKDFSVKPNIDLESFLIKAGYPSLGKLLKNAS